MFDEEVVKINGVEEGNRSFEVSYDFFAFELRERIGELIESKPDLSFGEILSIADISRKFVIPLFEKELPILDQDDSDTLQYSLDGIRDGVIEYEPGGPISSFFYKTLVDIKKDSSSDQYILIKERLNEYIEFLKSRFPPLKMQDVEIYLDFKNGRIQQMLSSEEPSYVTLDEMDGLRKLFFVLRRDDDDLSDFKKIIRKKFNQDEFRKVVLDYLKDNPEVFQGDVATFFGMSYLRLKYLLAKNGKRKSLNLQESKSFFRFKDESIVLTPRRIRINKDNLRQWLDFLLTSFPGLTQSSIEKLCGFRQHFLATFLSSKDEHYFSPSNCNALMNAYSEIKKNPSCLDKIPFDQGEFRRFVSVYLESHPNTSRKSLAILLNMGHERLKCIMLRDRKTLKPEEYSAYKKLRFEIL